MHPCNNILLFTHYAPENFDGYERKNHINLKASHTKQTSKAISVIAINIIIYPLV